MKVKKYSNERWAQVVPPTPTSRCHYMISSFGRMISIEKATGKENELKGGSSGGFRILRIRLKNGKSYAVAVHIFVGTHFIEKTSPDQEHVIHIDKDKRNNNVRNLKWITKQEYVEIKKARGDFEVLHQTSTHNAKLTESNVRIIKSWLRGGKTKRKVIAKRFGITTMQVSRIATGENWSHVE